MAIGDDEIRGHARATGDGREAPRERVPVSAVAVEDVCDALEISGQHLAHVDWTRVTLRGCRIRVADVAELVLDHARLIDTRFDEPDVMNLTGTDSTWRSVHVDGGRIAAWDLSGGVLDGVAVAGAQLGYVNLRDATLTDVWLRDCRIETLDLGGATVRRVGLPGCVIGELVVTRANLEQLDLRGAALDRVEGVADLSGATVSLEQLLDLAPALARALGISVGPWPE